MNLKYIFLQGALVVALAASAAPLAAFAQMDGASPMNGRQNTAVRPVESQLEMRTRKVDRAKAHGKRMIRREEAAIERLKHLIDRIERRIAKERAAGRDVSSLEPLMVTAKEKRDAAIAAVREATAKYELLGTTDNPRQVAQEANAATRKVKQALIELHAALRQIVSALKALR